MEVGYLLDIMDIKLLILNNIAEYGLKSIFIIISNSY